MATNKNIIMKQFNGTDYDTLYPKTVAAQIDDVYSKDETYPKSQLYTQSQLYTRQQILSDSTKGLFALGTDAVPDDVFSLLKTLIDTAQSTANGRARISTGTYIGTGSTGISNKKSLTFDFPVQLFILHDGSAPVGTGFYGAYPSLYCLFLPRNENGVDIRMYYGDSTSNWYYCNFQFKNNKVMWYAHDRNGTETPSADYQFNTSGKTYYYIAIG